MSAHARRYSRIREWRTAKAYAPKHRVGDLVVLIGGEKMRYWRSDKPTISMSVQR